jgi:PAS domain S-box-containing protein
MNIKKMMLYSKQKEKLKILVVAFILINCLFLTYYFHAVLDMGTFFTHFYYVPVILSALWWRRMGLPVAVVLAALLVLSHNLLREGATTANDYLRAAMFIVISIVVALLRDSIFKERERLEHMKERYRESEERFKQVVENAYEWIWEVNREGLYTYSSPMVKNILGYEKEEIIGKKYFYDLFHPESSEELKKETDEIFARKQHFRDFINRNIHRNGTEVWLLTSGIPMLDETGNLIGYRGVDKDITFQKRAEEALRESEEKYRTIIESIEEGYYEVDLEGNFTFFNDSLCKILGCTRKDLMGMNYRHYMDKRNYRKVSQSFKKLLLKKHKGKTVSGEIIRKDNNSRFIKASATLIRTPSGQPAGYRGILHDITECKRAEERIRASLREKELLLKEVHHRVKNNMQIISSLLNIQSRHVKDKKYRELFKKSQNRIHSMALVHEKLYKSKDLARIDFAEYIRNLATHLLLSYNSKPETVKLKIDANDIYLEVDKAIPCAQIANEIITNALLYAFPEGEGGEINIDFHRDKKGNYTLAISDNGVGIPRDRDYRSTDSLGLLLVSGLTKQLNGELKLDNSRGTKYTITF